MRPAPRPAGPVLLWQKQLFENGSAAFERKTKHAGPSPDERKIEALQAKLATKNEVIAELMGENVLLKNSMGRTERRWVILVGTMPL